MAVDEETDSYISCGALHGETWPFWSNVLFIDLIYYKWKYNSVHVWMRSFCAYSNYQRKSTVADKKQQKAYILVIYYDQV